MKVRQGKAYKQCKHCGVHLWETRAGLEKHEQKCNSTGAPLKSRRLKPATYNKPTRWGLSMLLLTALGSVRINAQTLPDAPDAQLAAVAVVSTQRARQEPAKPQHWPLLTRTELIDGGVFLAANLADYGTTERFLRVGGKEAELPAGLVESHAGFLAFKLAETAGEVEAERLLDRSQWWQRWEHRHKFIAPVAEQLGVAAVAGSVARVSVNNWEYAQNLQQQHHTIVMHRERIGRVK